MDGLIGALVAAEENSGGSSGDISFTAAGIQVSATVNNAVQLLMDGKINNLPLSTIANSARSANASNYGETTLGQPTVCKQLDSNRVIFVWSNSSTFTVKGVIGYINPTTGSISYGSSTLLYTSTSAPQYLDVCVLGNNKLALTVAHGTSGTADIIMSIGYTSNSTSTTLTVTNTAVNIYGLSNNASITNSGIYYMYSHCLVPISDSVVGLMVAMRGNSGSSYYVKYYAITYYSNVFAISLDTFSDSAGSLDSNTSIWFNNFNYVKFDDGKIMISHNYLNNGIRYKTFTVNTTTGKMTYYFGESFSLASGSSEYMQQCNGFVRLTETLYMMPFVAGYSSFANTLRFIIFSYIGGSISVLSHSTTPYAPGITVPFNAGGWFQIGEPYIARPNGQQVIIVPVIASSNNGNLQTGEIVIKGWTEGFTLQTTSYLFDTSNGNFSFINYGQQSLNSVSVRSLSDTEFSSRFIGAFRGGPDYCIPMVAREPSTATIRLNLIRYTPGKLIGIYKGNNVVMVKGKSEGHTNLPAGMMLGPDVNGFLTPTTSVPMGRALSQTVLQLDGSQMN